jgi:hypothetical protein
MNAEVFNAQLSAIDSRFSDSIFVYKLSIRALKLVTIEFRQSMDGSNRWILD